MYVAMHSNIKKTLRTRIKVIRNKTNFQCKKAKKFIQKFNKAYKISAGNKSEKKSKIFVNKLFSLSSLSRRFAHA